MFIKDNKRFNIYAEVIIDDIQYPSGFFKNPEARAEHGIEEIPDPVRESLDTHFVNEIDEAPYVINTPKPAEMVLAFYKGKLEQAVQGYLDETAQAKGYDGILSACTYATSTHPKFSAEGQACVEWRDAVWSKCYELLVEVESGERGIPTVEELKVELPVIVWPE